MANQRQWNLNAAMFTETNDGKFWKSDPSSPCYYFPAYMDDSLKDWKTNKTWLCPSAARPVWDEHRVAAPTLNIYNAWGIIGSEEHANLGPHGVCGSYGINGYVLIPQPPQSRTTYESGVPYTEGFKTNAVSGANNIPWWIEALRFDLWPLPTDRPAENEFAAWTVSAQLMARCAINRHRGQLTAAFLDWSVRKIGVKEVYTLKWHKSFNTKGPWTRAGGVRDEDWPDWIRPFKDY